MMMTTLKRNSYLFLAATFILAGWLGLGTPLVTVLFSYFVLCKLHVFNRNWMTVTLFVVLVSVICLALGYVLDQAVRTLPLVMERAVPQVIQVAKSHNLELPFSDWDSLKSYTQIMMKGEMDHVTDAAKIATKQFVFLIIGFVIAISLFLNSAKMLHLPEHEGEENLYVAFYSEIADRFRSLYQSFATVMGAQLLISTINTTLTSIFVIWIALPHAVVVIGVTFLCGMLPIVGNLISNTVIVGIALTVSPELAVWALAFLIVLHKLEYFLNSKIIGNQIKNPVWLTLIALILGERLMGITGMILAPVILHFIRIEASQVKLKA
ncbi:MAG: AI-2E family transporter [Verrucomicrobiota bacterium]